MEDYLTVFESADLTGYHPVYLGSLLRQGKITGTKKKGGWWVSRGSLLDYAVRQGKIQPAEYAAAQPEPPAPAADTQPEGAQP